MNRLIFVIVLLAALGCGLMAGVFFAFSTFVMKGLARLPAAQAITAMQSINVTAMTPTFMMALFGTAALCLALVAASFSMWHKPGTLFVLFGSLAYLAGAIVVTAACNVPLNNILASINAPDSDNSRQWISFLTSWTAWNHVRAVASLAATALFIIGLCRISSAGAPT
jgi:uncharacterized membrane protein